MSIPSNRPPKKSALELELLDTLQNWIKLSHTVPAAEKSPNWDVEDDPPQPNPRVWQAYRAELGDRARHLTKLLAQLRQRPDAAVADQILRTLHIIQAASLVIPVDEAARLTQHFQTRLAPLRATPRDWPLDDLERTAQWLAELAVVGFGPGDARVLQRGRELAAQFSLR